MRTERDHCAHSCNVILQEEFQCIIVEQEARIHGLKR